MDFAKYNPFKYSIFEDNDVDFPNEKFEMGETMFNTSNPEAIIKMDKYWSKKFDISTNMFKYV